MLPSKWNLETLNEDGKHKRSYILLIYVYEVISIIKSFEITQPNLFVHFEYIYSQSNTNIIIRQMDEVC
jgi:hypothetical protein